ncbi:MAG TPA: rhodanese-like domain-containing protein [Gammaproteobacteria bacterium]|nr:rhodanese-like domain-containing protein [Gammaproteobacteria bacterium]
MPIKIIDPRTLKAWLEKGEAFVIDVREPHEYHLAHIPDAILSPLAVLSVERMPDHGGKKQVVHCQHGKRGTLACERLVSADPTLEIYHLEGGLAAWINAGYDVSKSP